MVGIIATIGCLVGTLILGVITSRLYTVPAEQTPGLK